MMAEGWRKDEDWPRRRLEATAAWQQARARRPWARLGRHKRGHRLRGVDAPAEAEEFGGTRIAPLGRAIAPFSPPDANLLGPGPTEPSAEVLAAMATPLVGFFDEPYVLRHTTCSGPAAAPNTAFFCFGLLVRSSRRV